MHTGYLEHIKLVRSGSVRRLRDRLLSTCLQSENYKPVHFYMVTLNCLSVRCVCQPISKCYFVFCSTQVQWNLYRTFVYYKLLMHMNSSVGWYISYTIVIIVPMHFLRPVWRVCVLIWFALFLIEMNRAIKYVEHYGALIVMLCCEVFIWPP